MSWGSGSWGSGSWGGSPPSPPASVFDLYCFTDAGMAAILGDPDVSTVSSGSQIAIDGGSSDLLVRSGGVFAFTDARLYVTTAVPQTWTLEFTIRLDELPNDFTNLVSNHVFVGATDAAGPCAGLFISKIGIMYAGAVSHDGSGNMQIDSATQLLPGSDDLIELGKYIVFRIAADATTGVVYIYVTNLDDLPVTGLQLRYVLPVISAADLITTPTDRTTVSVRGTLGNPSSVAFDTLCLARSVVIPNLPPRANAGNDQAVRTCTVVQLDGSASFDPEGVPVLFSWRLIDAPITSTFAFSSEDGFTLPEAVPTGFTDLFYSADLGVEHGLDPIVTGDALLVGGEVYDIIAVGTDGNGFFVQVPDEVIPDNYTTAAFRVLRQRIFDDRSLMKPSFLPDVPGIYKFDLIVNDGVLNSEPSVTIVNVLESQLPKGCIPNLSFMWQYLSDFWNLVEGRERIEVFFQAMAQVAASELLTLWQVDYSKSLRDVQRTFQRRWLHYDLKLAEPLPELTRIRQIRGGVGSNFIPALGLPLNGTKTVITSPVLPVDIILDFTSPNPVTMADIFTVLVTAFEDFDQFTFEIQETAPNEGYFLLLATIPFSISSESTSSLFNVGDSNRHPSGTGGVAIGVRTYRVERSLRGVDIQENDILVIDGEGYKISRIIGDPADPFEEQRIVVKSDLPSLPGANWSICGHITSRLLNFYDGLVVPDDVVTLEVFDNVTRATLLLDTHAIGTVQTDVGVLGADLESVDQYLVDPDRYKVSLAKVIRRQYVPLDSLVVDVPCLQEQIATTEDGAVLRRNVDYFVDQFRGRNSIQFVADAGAGPDVWEHQVPPDRMWAEVTFIDNRPNIEANFGIPAEFTLDDLTQLSTNVDYLSAVRGLWYAYLNGPTIRNLRVGMQILLGLPFAEEDGVIEEIREDFSPTQGRILIRDSRSAAIVRSYSYPAALQLEVNPDTGQRYVVGDTVSQFAPLVEGAEVIDYVKDPQWFQGLLNQGVFFEIEKFFKFLARVDSNVFNLSALLFVQNFILRIKPTFTYPLFVVRSQITDTEISVTDQVSMSGRLILGEVPCGDFLGLSTIYDDPRPAGGGWRNQFDADADPNNAAPTYPTPDSPVLWAWDKQYLCPEEDVEAAGTRNFDGLTSITDQDFAPFGSEYSVLNVYQSSGPISVPSGSTGFSVPLTEGGTAQFTGNIGVVRLTIWGGPGSDPDDYELRIVVVASETLFPFTSNPGGNFEQFVVAIPINLGDSIAATIRHADGSARNPNWNFVRVEVVTGVFTWANLATPPACRLHRLRQI